MWIVSHLWIVSIVALAIVVALCTVGTFHRMFQDNTWQRVGMALLVIGGVGRINWLWEFRSTEPSWTVVHVGVACYAIGTTYKVLILNGRERGWRLVVRFDRWLFHRKSQAGAFDSRPHHHH